MDNYEKLIGDIGDILIAHPSESVSKMFLQEAVNAIEQLVKERNAAIADLEEYASCDYCMHSNSSCEEYWSIGECGLHGLCGGEKFKWRGVQNGY